MKRTSIALSLLASLACLFAASSAQAQLKRRHWDEPPKMEIDPNKTYTATIETSKGSQPCGPI